MTDLETCYELNVFMFPALRWASIARSSEDLIKTKVVISDQELNVSLRSEADTQPGGSQSNISE